MADNNELQTINIAVKRYLNELARTERQKLNLWYANELANGRGNTVYKASDIPFDRNNWLDTTTKTTMDAMIEGAEVGLGGVYSIASVQKTSKYFLGLTSDGVTLSETLRDSARDAERLAVEAINTHLEHKTTWKRLTNELTASNVSKGDLPKYLEELAESAKGAGGDSLRMRKLIKQANARVAQLAQNGAPTRDLQKAYQKVIDAVERGDKTALNRSLQKAIDTKAVYNNSRISRTELSRAYSKGFKRQLFDHPEYKNGNAYVRVMLSPNHNVVDVCDMVTEADLHNMGSGVYPSNEAPLVPLHPNCLCLYEIVVEFDVDGRTNNYSEQRAEEYLSTRSDSDRRRIEYSIENTKLRSLTALPVDQVTKQE